LLSAATAMGSGMPKDGSLEATKTALAVKVDATNFNL
jgi:hypothetical protein